MTPEIQTILSAGIPTLALGNGEQADVEPQVAREPLPVLLLLREQVEQELLLRAVANDFPSRKTSRR